MGKEEKLFILICKIQIFFNYILIVRGLFLFIVESDLHYPRESRRAQHNYKSITKQINKKDKDKTHIYNVKVW